MSELWDQITGRGGIELGEERRGKLVRYLNLLLAANERMNLTRIADREAAEVQHVADALTLLEYLPRGGIRIADLGSGGGVPGLVLAIVRPETGFTLIEATKKKADFLRRAAGELGLANVEVIGMRAEDVGNGSLRERFDAVTVRAVAGMGWLAEWGLPLLKKGGKLLAMKGPKAEEETKAAGRVIARIGGKFVGMHSTGVPELDGHVIVEIEKIGRTPAAYPRAASIAKGKMLE